MIKKICFFSAGFAFNRLVRLRYYEKIFPKDVEIFLFTTSRYKGKEKESYQYEWGRLKRTKIIVVDYNIYLPITLRKFCKNNNIDRIVNLGNRRAFPLFLFSSLLSNTRYIPSMMGWVPNVDCIKKLNLKEIWQLSSFYFFSIFSEKIITNDYGIYKRYNSHNIPILSKLFISKNKVRFLPVTVDSDLFTPKNKIQARKKLKLSINKKIVIFVGRTGRCANILVDLIKKNQDILFLIIGRITDNLIPKLKAKNFIHYPKKTPEELVDYYNAADIHIALHDKKGAGLGLAAEESLACGVPTMVPFTVLMENSPALFQIKLDKNEAENTISEFFRKSEKEREALSKNAREYALRNFANYFWENRYRECYLN